MVQNLSDVKLWRRGPAPTPAGHSTTPSGEIDYGLAHPGSVAWRVFSHPAVIALETPVTSILQFSRADMGANMLQHDPLLTAGERGEATPAMVISRERRTIGVVVPALAGDTASANRIGAHIRGFHRNMTGVIPGTDQPYDAAGPDMVLYGHVTIMHAALTAYERAAFNGIHPPHRLSDEERDQYWDEVAGFAVLMGSRKQDVPRSSAEVEQYYEACKDDYYNAALMVERLLRTSWNVIQPRNWKHPGDVALGLTIGVGHLLATTIVPAPARRRWGIPTGADPILSAVYYGALPAFALISVPAIGDRIVKWLLGPENLALVENLRELQKQHVAKTHSAA